MLIINDNLLSVIVKDPSGVSKKNLKNVDNLWPSACKFRGRKSNIEIYRRYTRGVVKKRMKTNMNDLPLVVNLDAFRIFVGIMGN